MTRAGDDELRARFQELRDGDRAAVPPFREVWDQAETRARLSRASRAPAALAMAAAASVVLAAGILLGRAGTEDSTRQIANSAPLDADGVQSISTWTSPTESLLRTSGRDLLAPPSIHSSILDGVTSTPRQREGEQP